MKRLNRGVTMNMTKAATPFQWLKIYNLYRSAFPRSERKPFSMIYKMSRKGKTDVWYCTDHSSFIGLAITINGPDKILLDYFAIDDKHRNGGYGSRILEAIIERYSPMTVFGEIENVVDEGEDLELRKRRKAFYLRNGLKEIGVMVYLFGVKMELLTTDAIMTFEEYRNFYRDNYSQWAANHIHPAEYETGDDE
jgi:GNAT superfamily N-acetyltransferase